MNTALNLSFLCECESLDRQLVFDCNRGVLLRECLQKLLLLDSSHAEPIGNANKMGPLFAETDIIAGRRGGDADVDSGPASSETPDMDASVIGAIPETLQRFDQAIQIADLGGDFCEV